MKKILSILLTLAMVLSLVRQEHQKTLDSIFGILSDQILPQY